MPECDYQCEETERTIIFSTRSFKANDINLCDVLSLAITGGRKNQGNEFRPREEGHQRGSSVEKGRLLKGRQRTRLKTVRWLTLTAFSSRGFIFPSSPCAIPALNLLRGTARRRRMERIDPRSSHFRWRPFHGQPFLTWIIGEERCVLLESFRGWRTKFQKLTRVHSSSNMFPHPRHYPR